MRRFGIHPYALLLWSIVFAPLMVATWWALLAAAPCEILGHDIVISPDGQRTARVITRVCPVGPFMDSAVDRVEVHHADGSDELVFEAEAADDKLDVVWEGEHSLALYRVAPTGERTLRKRIAVRF